VKAARVKTTCVAISPELTGPEVAAFFKLQAPRHEINRTETIIANGRFIVDLHFTCSNNYNLSQMERNINNNPLQPILAATVKQGRF
jgi:hypothetical protein